jgi:hypothetical protein
MSAKTYPPNRRGLSGGSDEVSIFRHFVDILTVGDLDVDNRTRCRKNGLVCFANIKRGDLHWLIVILGIIPLSQMPISGEKRKLLAICHHRRFAPFAVFAKTCSQILLPFHLQL